MKHTSSPKWLRSLLVLFILSGLLLPTPGRTPAARAQSSLEFEFTAPDLEIRLQPDGASLLDAPGYARLAHPGRPQLLYQAVLAAVPPGAEPRLEILDLQESELALPAPLAVAPFPQGVLLGQDGLPVGGAFGPGETGAEEALAVAPEAIDSPVVLEPVGVLRGVRLVRLVYYPARPQGGGLRLANQVRVRLHFDGAGTAAAQAPDSITAGLLQGAVVNPSALAVEVPVQVEAASPQAVTAGERAVIEVAQEGLVSVTHEALSSAGFPLGSASLSTLQLSRAGVEIPFEVDGDGDDRLEPGERLLFYASPRFSRYAAFDAYFLTQGASARRQIETRPALSAGLAAGSVRMQAVFEQNRLYTPDCYCAPIPAGRDGDRWVWEELRRPDRPEVTLPFDLPDVGAGTARLTAWLIGFTNLPASPDHRVEFSLNGQNLGQAQWDGKKAQEVALDVPSGLLRSAGNELVVRLPGLPGIDFEGVWLDAFRVEYNRAGGAAGGPVRFSGASQARAYTLSLSTVSGLRAYDITNPDRPIRLQSPGVSGAQVSISDAPGQGGRRYWVGAQAAAPARVRLAKDLPGNLRGSDYLVIAPAAFHAALQPLLELRRSQGLQAALVDVQAVYDAADGRPQPEAIRDFLELAYTTWSPRPSYVLLAGDGTYDPKHYQLTSTETFIPPFLVDSDPWAGETAADNRYATLEGDDLLPDLLIGRLPVNSAQETATVVAKILAYENGGAGQRWKSRALYVADDADASGPFAEQAERLTRTGFARSMFPTRLYFESGWEVEKMRQSLFEAWDRGAGLLFYNGHSSIHQWAAETFFHLNDVGSLKNAERLPVVLELTCFTGSFQVPGFRTLDEALVTQAGGGAVAAWGPTGLGILTGQSFLAEGFLNRLAPDGQASLGEAALAGKVNLAAVGIHQDLLDTYTILGDPALSLHFEPVEIHTLYLSGALRP